MGSGGPSNTRTTQTTSMSPTASRWGNALLNTAGPYYLGTPYPSNLNQNVAGFTPDQLAAMGLISGATGPASTLGGAGSSFLTNILGNGIPLNNPPIDTFAGPTAGQNMQGILSGMGLGGTTGMLSDTIGGKYLDPATNPWLTSTFNEAATGVKNQYNLSTAPSLMAEGEIASGGGPGAFAGSSAANQQQWANQYGLGQNLDNLATNIYGGAYQQERQNQLAAASQAEGLAGTAGSLYNTGVGNQINYTLGGQSNQIAAANARTGALGLLPSTQSSLYGPANQLLASGGLQQQQQQTVLDTIFQNAMRQAQWPQQMYAGLASLIGPATGNAGTQITTGPNPMATK